MPRLQSRTNETSGGPPKFFLIALAHNDMANYYKMNFALMQFHGYTLSDIENMIPFEREVYIALLEQYLQEEKDKRAAAGN